MKIHTFYLHIKTNALLSDALLRDMGPQNLKQGIDLGIYKEVKLTSKQASEYNVLGLEDE